LYTCNWDEKAPLHNAELIMEYLTAKTYQI